MSDTDAPLFYWHESPGNRFRVDVADFDEAETCEHCRPVYSADVVDRLRARVAELEKDAARYRWLRHGDNDDAVICGDTHGLAFLPRNTELDVAIDAAMSPCTCSDIQAAHGHHFGCPTKDGAP